MLSSSAPQLSDSKEAMFSSLDAASLEDISKLSGLESWKELFESRNDKDWESLGKLRDFRGNTLLHKAVMTEDATCLQLVISSLGKVALDLAKVTNYAGKTPFQLLCGTNSLDLAELLVPLTLESTLKGLGNLSDQLVAQEVLKNIPEAKNDEELTELVKLSCEAVNFVRKSVENSNTHPKINECSEEKKEEIGRKIYFLRKAISGYQASSEACIIKIQEFAVGNCTELTALALYYISNIKSRLVTNIETLGIPNGDHVLGVINRRDKSKANDPFTWGARALVIDPLLGKIFTPSALFSELRIFSSVYVRQKDKSKKTYVFTGLMNPNYHKMKVTAFSSVTLDTMNEDKEYEAQGKPPTKTLTQVAFFTPKKRCSSLSQYCLVM